MIEIDGSYLEGGGQIIRTAIAFSAITKKAVRVFNIRKGREKPGLRPQHLHGIAAAGQICGAETNGLNMNSTDITFVPGGIKGGRYHIDTKTAGSVTLILQTLVPIGLHSYSPLEFIVKGGTAVPYSPTTGYFLYVLSPVLQMMGSVVELEVKAHGFYPQGGGHVSARIAPSRLNPLVMKDRGALKEIRTWIVASRYLKRASVAERISKAFTGIFKEAKVECSYVDALSPGCFITTRAQYDSGILGGSALGKRGKPAEEVGKDAANELKMAIDSNAAVDKWMVDQLVPYIALSTYGTSRSSEIRIPSLTRHAQANIWVVEKFLPVKFSEERGLLKCAKTE